jgi:predicted amidohydrolase YtcJ
VILNAELVGADRTGLTALAVADGRIVAVGQERDVRAWIGPNTRLIQAKGRSLIPGLIDSHMHTIRAGLTELTEVHWSGVRRLDQALRLLQQKAQNSPSDVWIVVAGGWTPDQFEEKRSPTAAELQQAVGDRAAYVQRAYSAVLITPTGMQRLPWARHADLASRLKSETDRDGKETGWLAGDARAISDVYNLLPPPDAQAQLNGTLAWYQRLSRWGMTGIVDPGGYNLPPSAYQATQTLWQQGKLPLRLRFSLSAPKAGSELADFQQLSALMPMGWGDEWLRFNGLGENVTWGMYNNSAPSEKDKAHLEETLRWAAQRGMGVTFHWNQNETVHHLLEVLERVGQSHDLRPLRWSIAHLNNASLENLQRMKQLGMGWLVQNASYFQRTQLLQQVGEAALTRTPPLGDAMALGLPVGLGTDAHRVMDPNPFVSLQWAIDGLSVDGKPTRQKPHLLDREEALTAYTQGSAWFSHEENERGRLAVGQRADLALLNDSYLKIETSRIHTLSADMTWVSGLLVHDATGRPSHTIKEKP